MYAIHVSFSHGICGILALALCCLEDIKPHYANLRDDFESHEPNAANFTHIIIKLGERMRDIYVE